MVLKPTKPVQMTKKGLKNQKVTISSNKWDHKKLESIYMFEATDSKCHKKGKIELQVKSPINGRAFKNIVQKLQ